LKLVLTGFESARNILHTVYAVLTAELCSMLGQFMIFVLFIWPRPSSVF
jgi:hypothetical protein